MEFGKITPIDLQRYLGGVSYPANKEELARQAKEKGAGPDILGLINKLPDREYKSPADISYTVGKLSSG